MKKLFALLIFMAFSARAEELKVVDGDSIVVHNQMIRLVGIDAPEYSQKCYNAQNEAYDCGQEALKYLEKLINTEKAKGLKIECKKFDTDKYKRDLSTCKIGQINLNQAMVAAGYAITYRHKWYEKDEKEAKTAKKGIWQGRFMRPELYRILKKYEKSQK